MTRRYSCTVLIETDDDPLEVLAALQSGSLSRAAGRIVFSEPMPEADAH